MRGERVRGTRVRCRKGSKHGQAVYALLSSGLTLFSTTPTMSSSTTSSNFQFRVIFDAALSDYTKETSIDLVTHPSAQTLQNCCSADAVFDLLQDRAKQFQAYRDGNRKLIDCLKPVVQVLHTVSGILNEAAASVSNAILLVLFGTHFYASDTRFHSNLQRQSSLVSMSSLLYESSWCSEPF